MRKVILGLLISILFVAANQINKDPRLLSLHVDLSAVADRPTIMIVKKHGLGEYEVTTDTSKINATIFTYSSALIEPELQDIIFMWPDGKKKSASFRAIGANYLINFDKNQNLVIKDLSKPTLLENEFNELENLITTNRSEAKILIGKVDYENRKIEDVEMEINRLKDSMEMVLDTKIYHPFIVNHLNSFAGLYALTKYADRPLERQRRKWVPSEIQTLMSQIHPTLKKTPTFKILSNKLIVKESLSPGKKLPDLSLIDTAGKSIQISDFRGKYLLVEFWASWCIPCREESPKLIEHFIKYRPKGFEIVGITIDKLPMKESWLKAIKNDGIGKWPQLSDFNGIAQKKYDIGLIPSNFLVDRDGTIIAFDLRGDELETKLKEIMRD